MARNAFNTTELLEVKSDLKDMESNLREESTIYGYKFSSNVKNYLENYNYNSGSSPRPDSKPDQVDLADSWSHKASFLNLGISRHRISSSAPHAEVIDQGTEGGWKIPKTKAELGEDESLEDFGTSGVSWLYIPGVGNGDKYATELVKDSGRFFYPSVTAGSYDGKYYVQTSLRGSRRDTKDINKPTRDAIVEAGFKPGR
jgi:hypothetical protein